MFYGKNEILMINGTDYQAMTEKLMERSEFLKDYPDKNARIGIKPNLVVASSAASGAITHPEIVEGVIHFLQQHGYQNFCVLEGSWVGARTEIAYRTSGIGDVCRKYGVECIDLQKDTSSKVQAGDMELNICDEALKLDLLINLPVLKGHCQTIMTCALKNHKGLIPNTEKRRFHSMGLHKPIAALSAAFPNEFILIDNICGDLDFEEGGNPVEMNRILCAKDPVLTDAFACETMGHSAQDVRYIRLAEQLGVGCADLEKAKITALNDCEVGNNKRPRGVVAELAGYTQPKDACSACYGSLIYALAQLEREDGLNERKKICIGQGYRGQKGDIGVGQCTACFKKTLGGCPPTAAQMKEFLRKNW